MDHPLYTVDQIRAIEHTAAARLAPGTLMRRAGEAAAALALELLGGTGGSVLVLAGPGNNGGDALEVAANLAAAGASVDVLQLDGGKPAPAPEASRALARARSGTARFVDALPAAPGLVVDGLFGIGLTRPLAGAVRAAVDAVAAFGCPVLALDVPSGLDADTGTVVGPGGAAVRATHTITFLGDKPGLHTGDGCDFAGHVRVATLGAAPVRGIDAHARLNLAAGFAAHLTPRRRNTHKGSFGDIAVLGGARGMRGAAVLAARAALYGGAGRVFAASVDRGLDLDPLQPEIMWRDAAGFPLAGRAVVAGPGMGTSDAARHCLDAAVAGDGPLLLDADALNLLAADPDLQARVAARGSAGGGPAVLTPHPLEAARLLGVTAAIVQADRLENARELAMRLDAIVVLKGAGTVIARPDGEVAINPTGNPGLATGGSGDVLSGLIGALLAQGWPAWESALAGVWLHGAAADRLVEEGCGPIGMTAGELPRAIRTVLNELATRSA
jgi:hydroxyethylthiazole kinase-like uncharacterized protein yjeF